MAVAVAEPELMGKMEMLVGEDRIEYASVVDVEPRSVSVSA
jgi:hypothetical protein